MPQDLNDLWTSNAFGDISGWESLPPEELHRECEEMIAAWADNGWNVNDISTEGMIEFLKKEWAKEKKFIFVRWSPNDLEFANGDRYDHESLVERFFEFCEKEYPQAECDVGVCRFRGESLYQGIGMEVAERFFGIHGADEDLFVTRD